MVSPAVFFFYNVADVVTEEGRASFLLQRFFAFTPLRQRTPYWTAPFRNPFLVSTSFYRNIYAARETKREKERRQKHQQKNLAIACYTCRDSRIIIPSLPPSFTLSSGPQQGGHDGGQLGG